MRGPGPVVVMGVSGSGKTRIGTLLAARLGVTFVDGDDLHPPENVAAMAAGRPLDDALRAPWLDRVGSWLVEHPDGVVACSALRRAYRDRLRSWSPGAVFVHLDGPVALVRSRMEGRSHFMPPSLLGSQVATLEPLAEDEAGVVLDLALAPDELVARAGAWLAESSADGHGGAGGFTGR